MSYYVVYGHPKSVQPVAGDEIASTSGWVSFQEWAADLDDCPELNYLAEHGEVFTGEGEEGDALEILAKELRLAIKQNEPEAETLGVAKKLQTAVQRRPPGSFWLGITDGTEP